ncbi:putative TIR domain, winged helix-turn-helix DNA-binding domain-containing protein [Medicago truncatula]|nr:TMV resistance protein N [Medicago truncatula]RHN49898.1 putative TIR domain, winged helix-turn-helix DNA-binding domain-containing protein [Medicago truncatula]
MAMPQSSSSSSSSSSKFTYNVFLSFRGADTRHGFTGNLYDALCKSGVHTFKDDEELQRGGEITASLMKAIEESRIFIPVFSKNYASSSFCLDELVHIIRYSKSKGRLVLPVFYDIAPTHVRKQTGSIGEELAKHQEKFQKNMERLQEWKMALKEAAELSGHHFNLAGRPDIRDGFTGNLYDALRKSGVHTFMDDEELQRGGEITPSLVKAIEESRIFIPVFSKDYASSSFCLDELVHIIRCSKSKGRPVLPVFCNIDPNHVRNQTGSIGEELAKHQEKFQKNMKRLREWKKALKQAADLSGYHFDLAGTEYESNFIQGIVKEVSRRIDRVPLHVTEFPVGLESQVLKVKSLMDVGCHDGAQMIGIHGIGGIGKTTLAKEIYNRIYDQFDKVCFLHDVREICSTKYGLVHLQEQLLFQTVGLNDKLGHVSEGIQFIKERLQQKKVLLILDDVDQPDQLKALAGDLNWFCGGSKVIVTTRDKHLLASYGVEKTYEVNGLNEKDALDLLRWKVCKSNKIGSSYEGILEHASRYSSGLPLALEVVGSDLSGKSKDEWSSTLARYERTVPKNIQQILKVSFDALQEEDKSLFLDIACFFKGCRLEEFQDILDAHYTYCIKNHIGVLVEKSLIKIIGGCVTLHDLIEEMGKEIVRQESPKEPGKRSRLWSHEDIVPVLHANSGTRKIEILYLNFSLSKEEEVEWKGDELKKMENLRTIIIRNCPFSKGCQHLPNGLRVLDWPKYPSENLPSDFFPRKLSICRLRESSLTTFEFPSSSKKFLCMRELNLDHNQSLTQILDISGLLNLEILSFRDCSNLITIHNSIGFLNKLKILNVTGCSKLSSFPPIKLTSLLKLELSHCNNLKSFPEILGDMKHITYIELVGTSIEQFPFSFQNLSMVHTLQIFGSGKPHNLSWINARENDIPSSTVYSNVQFLHLIECNPSNDFLRRFVNVEVLDLSGSNLTVLSKCLKECHFLQRLCLNDCKYLQEITGIPPSLKRLSALQCNSLTSSCRSMLLSQHLHEDGGTEFSLAGSARVPEWFDHQSEGPSISFWFRGRFPSIALFVASLSTDNRHPNSDFLSLTAHLRTYTDGIEFDINSVDLNLVIQPDHTYLYDLRQQVMELESDLEKTDLIDEWIHAEITFKCEGGREEELFIESGVHVFKLKTSMEDIRFTNPHN